MEFLKKNYGLLLCVLLCLGTIIWLSLLCMKQRALCVEYDAQIQGCEDFFAKINGTGLNLTPDTNGDLENLIISENNLEKVTTHYKNLLTECITRYRITPEARTLPLRNPALAKEMIEKQLSIIDNQVVASKIAIVTRGGASGSARSTIAPEITRLFKDGRQINDDEVKQAFRQMEIYRRILTLIADAEIVNVQLLELPCVFSTIPREGYTITPLYLSVIGDAQQIQNFYNSLTFCENTFFNIKSLGIEFVGISSPGDIFTKYFCLRYNAKNEKLDRENGFNGSSGMSMMSGKGGLLRSSNIVGPALMGGVSNGGYGSSVDYSSYDATSSYDTSKNKALYKNDPGAWVEEKIERQDFLAYNQKRMYRMDLNIDIIEFTLADGDEEDDE